MSGIIVPWILAITPWCRLLILSSEIFHAIGEDLVVISMVQNRGKLCNVDCPTICQIDTLDSCKARLCIGQRQYAA